MSAYHTHQEITKRLKALSDQLSNGDLSEDELKEFETLSRRIYERAIVLNYKAKEAHVYSKSVSNELVEEVSPKTKEVEKEESSPAKPEEPEVSEKTPIESGEIAFDFSSSDGEEEAKETVSQTKQEEVIQKEEPSKNPEPVKQEKPAEPEPKVEPEPTKEVPVPEEKISSFFERLTKVHDDSLMSKLGASKLDTLNGAIGLNDKMQFISELFDGSSELFNETIEKLDQQQNNEKARFYLSEIAVKQNWDVENPLVEEFARILDRRYAE
jgi:hypothetical protein